MHLILNPVMYHIVYLIVVRHQVHIYGMCNVKIVHCTFEHGTYIGLCTMYYFTVIDFQQLRNPIIYNHLITVFFNIPARIHLNLTHKYD